MRTSVNWVVRVLPLMLLAACTGMSGAIATPSPTTTSTTTLDNATSATALSARPVADVPRNRTLILAALLHSPIGVTNPWASPGYTHEEGNSLLWEGLAYYAIFADREIPWLATSINYTRPDFTELTIKLNPLARWSDGSR
jgi:peptide/nickel transport system substrate-binding protein